MLRVASRAASNKSSPIPVELLRQERVRSRPNPRPTPGAGSKFQDLDLENVAGPGSLDEYRTGEGVNTLVVNVGKCGGR